MSGLTMKQRRNMIEIEREAIKHLLDDQRKIRAAIIAREQKRKAREADRILAQHARIAKMEQRLQDLRDKAARKAAKAVRKAGPVTVYSPEQIAALNAANGAV